MPLGGVMLDRRELDRRVFLLGMQEVGWQSTGLTWFPQRQQCLFRLVVMRVSLVGMSKIWLWLWSVFVRSTRSLYFSKSS